MRNNVFFFETLHVLKGLKTGTSLQILLKREHFQNMHPIPQKKKTTTATKLHVRDRRC